MIDDKSTYRMPQIMPIPICHACGDSTLLDPLTYWNYRGSVTCSKCKSAMNIVTSNGQMLESGPLINPEYVTGLHNGIPAQPLGDYHEAITDLVHGAFKSSAVMQRRSLQGALLAREVPDDTPMKMIQWAHSHKMFGPKELSLATTVTFFGGKGAHPEDTDINNVGELEAGQGLRVTKELLVALFPPQPQTRIVHPA